VLSRRTDSDYWIENRGEETIPERLRELLALWRHRAPLRNDFPRIEEVFPTASYQYVLYGMGFRAQGPVQTQRGGRHDPALADGYFREAHELTRRMLAALPDNRSLIDHIRQHGLPRI
jgi:tryptophan halogenase